MPGMPIKIIARGVGAGLGGLWSSSSGVGVSRSASSMIRNSTRRVTFFCLTGSASGMREQTPRRIGEQNMTRLGLRHEGAEVLVGADADLYLPVVDVVHEI